LAMYVLMVRVLWVRINTVNCLALIIFGVLEAKRFNGFPLHTEYHQGGNIQ